jgi:hypothetical protein
MPTVVGNETYKFNFEFYDVNNNYVPVAVTQSAVFTGGNNNIGGTLIFISASASSSAAELAAVSSSISGTMTVYSSSASGSITTLSGSVSGSITTLSGSVSSSISSLSSSVSSSNVFILSSSLSKTQQLADGRYSGSFIGDTVIYSPTIGGQQGYISDLFKVGTSPSIYLDARQNPRKIFIGGVTDSGSYNNSNTSVYMDSTGKFSLKNKLTWDGNDTLTVTGQINIVAGGNAATQTYANTIGTNSVLSGSAAASAVDDKVFTNALGRITKAPSVGTQSGLYLGNTNLGYYDGGRWKTYMDNTGLFYLTGSANGNALLWDGSTLTIKGNLAVGSAVPNSVVTGLGTLATKSSVAAAEIDAGAVTNAKIAADAVTEAKIATDAVTSGKISANAIVADKIAANAIVADKIAAGAITAGKILAGAIEADKIAAGAITAGKIAAGAVTAEKVDVAGVITAGSIVVGGSNISALNNNLGFQANDSAKTAGSVGGWTISGTDIKSNNNQTIFYNTGIISLTDGSSEKILITKDSLTKSSNSATISIPNGDNASGTQNSSHNYMTTWSQERTATAQSSTFTAQGVSIICNIPYGGGNESGLSGTVGWSTTLSNFKSIQNTTSKYINVKLYTSGGTLVGEKDVNVYFRQDILGTNQNYTFPYIGGGSTSVAFSGLSVGSGYYVIVNVTKRLSSSYIAWVFGASITATYAYYGFQSTNSPIDITSAAEKTSIGVNGMIASSAGGFAQVGPVASIGGTPYSAAFLGNVRVNGELQASSVITTSDERLKTNIIDIESPLLKIEKLKPKSFIWNNKLAPYSEQNNSFGFIAQEVERDFPFLVKTIGNSDDIDDIRSLDYNAIVPINTAAIKELIIKIEQLEERILELENQ